MPSKRKARPSRDIEALLPPVAELGDPGPGDPYRVLFESNPHPMWICDAETLAFLAVNEAAVHQYGYSQDEFLRMTIKDIRPPENVADLLEHVLRAIRPFNWAGAWRHRKKDGTIIDVEISGCPLHFAGRPAVVILANDVTERSRAEALLSMRARQQAAVAELGRRALEGIDLSALMDEAARLVARTLEVECSKVLELLPDGAALHLRAGVGWKEGLVGRAVVGGGRDSQAGYTLLSDEPVVVEDLRTETRFTGAPLLHEHGVVSGMSVMIRGPERPFGVLGAHTTRQRTFTDDDVHFLQAVANVLAAAIQQQRVQKDLRRRRRVAESLADVGRLITQSLDPDEVGQRITDSVRSLFGAPLSIFYRLNPASGELVRLAVSGEAAAFDWNQVLPPAAGSSGVAVRERRPVVTPDLLSDPRITLTPEGRARLEKSPYRARLAVPLMVKGEAIGTLSIGDRLGRVFTQEEVRLAQAFADQASIALENSRLYSELRAALEEVEASQQRIVQTERLRALGELAGGVAHDFNNNLAVILGRVELLLAQVRGRDARRQLQVVQKAALDGARTVRRIDEFTRRTPVRHLCPVSPNRVVEEIVQLTRPRWEADAEAEGISYDVVVKTAPLPPVAGDPSELRQALTNIMLNALDAMPDGGRVTFQTGVESDRVFLSVTDTGIGMSEEVRQRVFDPFFTTKGEKGSGLGLSVVYGIITRHGGEIEVRSQEGQGSVFTVRLPVSRELPEAPPRVTPPAPRRAKILLIDDDELVRETLGDLLVREGHAVAACPDGYSGLARLEETPFDLVITDLAMPLMPGWEVAKQVKIRHPEIPVVLVTGYSDRIDSEEARAKGVDFLLPKPFGLDDVKEVLAGSLALARAARKRKKAPKRPVRK